jgi:ribosome-interacting GTPase 1
MTKAPINYKNGKIYKIEPIIDHDDGDIYIGSTTKQYLCQRMTAHRKKYKYESNKNNCKCLLLFDKYGIDNCDIILLEEVEANNKMELLQREAHYIKTLKCVNKYIPLRTDKEYYEDNKDKYIIWRKNWNEANKDKMKEYYREYSKKRYEANKNAINERIREKRRLKKNQEQPL